MSGKTEEVVRRYSSAQFAYLGDAVFEVFVRERLVKEGGKSPSVRSPMATRVSRSTVRPTARHMRRIWRLRPSWITTRSTVSFPFVSSAVTAAGLVV